MSVPTSYPDVSPTVYRPTRLRSGSSALAARDNDKGLASYGLSQNPDFTKRCSASQARGIGDQRTPRVSQNPDFTKSLSRRQRLRFRRCGRAAAIGARGRRAVQAPLWPPLRPPLCPAVPPPGDPAGGTGRLLRRRAARPPSSRVAAAPAPPALYAGGNSAAAFRRRASRPPAAVLRRRLCAVVRGRSLPRRLGRWRWSGAIAPVSVWRLGLRVFWWGRLSSAVVGGSCRGPTKKPAFLPSIASFARGSGVGAFPRRPGGLSEPFSRLGAGCSSVRGVKSPQRGKNGALLRAVGTVFAIGTCFPVPG